MAFPIPSEAEYCAFLSALYCCHDAQRLGLSPADVGNHPDFEGSFREYKKAARLYPVPCDTTNTVIEEDPTVIKFTKALHHSIAVLTKALATAEAAQSPGYNIRQIILASIPEPAQSDPATYATSVALLGLNKARLQRNRNSCRAYYETKEAEWRALVELRKGDRARIVESYGKEWWEIEWEEREPILKEATKQHDEEVARARVVMEDAGVVVFKLEWWITMIVNREKEIERAEKENGADTEMAEA
jgi:hypothetical protein